MYGVNAGHHEIEPEEELRCVALGRVEAKVRSGHEVLEIFRAILDALDHEERDAKRQRGAEQQHRPAAPPDRRRADRERHREAAGQQHGGVDRSEREIRVPAGCREGLREAQARHEIAEEEHAKEQRLGGEKHPHAEIASLALLIPVAEGAWAIYRRRVIVAAHAPAARRAPPDTACGGYAYGSWITMGGSAKFSTGGGEGTVHSNPVACHGLAVAFLPRVSDHVRYTSGRR